MTELEVFDCSATVPTCLLKLAPPLPCCSERKAISPWQYRPVPISILLCTTGYCEEFPSKPSWSGFPQRGRMLQWNVNPGDELIDRGHGSPSAHR